MLYYCPEGATLTDVVDLVQHHHSDEAALGETLKNGTPSFARREPGPHQQVDDDVVRLNAVLVEPTQALDQEALILVLVLVGVVTLDVVFRQRGSFDLVCC